MTDKREPKIHEIEAQRWQNELIEALEATKPAWFYRAEEAVSLVDGEFEYRTEAFMHNVAFIVSDQELSEIQLKEIGKRLIENYQ